MSELSGGGSPEISSAHAYLFDAAHESRMWQMPPVLINGWGNEDARRKLFLLMGWEPGERTLVQKPVTQDQLRLF